MLNESVMVIVELESVESPCQVHAHYQFVSEKPARLMWPVYPIGLN